MCIIYGGFLSHGGTPNHPFLFGIFHETTHPAIGVPPVMETAEILRHMPRQVAQGCRPLLAPWLGRQEMMWNNKTWADVQKCHKVSRCFFSICICCTCGTSSTWTARQLPGPFNFCPWQRGCWNRYPATWADRDPSCAFLQRPPGRSRSSCRTTATRICRRRAGIVYPLVMADIAIENGHL